VPQRFWAPCPTVPGALCRATLLGLHVDGALVLDPGLEHEGPGLGPTAPWLSTVDAVKLAQGAQRAFLPAAPGQHGGLHLWVDHLRTHGWPHDLPLGRTLLPPRRVHVVRGGPGWCVGWVVGWCARGPGFLVATRTWADPGVGTAACAHGSWALTPDGGEGRGEGSGVGRGEGRIEGSGVEGSGEENGEGRGAARIQEMGEGRGAAGDTTWGRGRGAVGGEKAVLGLPQGCLVVPEEALLALNPEVPPGTLAALRTWLTSPEHLAGSPACPQATVAVGECTFPAPRSVCSPHMHLERLQQGREGGRVSRARYRYTVRTPGELCRLFVGFVMAGSMDLTSHHGWDICVCKPVLSACRSMRDALPGVWCPGLCLCLCVLVSHVVACADSCD
jgi:hypothetical protein